MAFDPSVISQIGTSMPNPIEGVAGAYRLSDIINKQQVGQMQLETERQSQRDLQTLKGMAGSYDLSKPEDQTKFAAEAIKVSPDLGLKLQKQFTEAQSGQNELTKSQYEVLGKQLELEATAVAPLWQQASQLEAQGRSPQEIDAAMLPTVMQTIKTLSQQTLPNGKPALEPQAIQALTSKLQGGNIKGVLDGVMMSHSKGAEWLKAQGNRFGKIVSMTGEQGAGMYQQNPQTGQFTMVGGQAPTAAERGGAGDGGPKVHSSKILDDGTVVNVMADGKVEVQTPDGESVTGDARREALKSANQQGADIQGERARARQKATDAAKTANQAFGSVQAIRSNIGNLKEAITAIDKGANTGAIASRFPNLTNAAVELQNIQSKLGLDVIGSVTFGALNLGELDLALQTALPTNLDEPQLKEWLTRRIAAQEKLSDYLTKQATYLSRPGATQAGWMEKMQTEQSSPPPSSGVPTPSPSGAAAGGAPSFTAPAAPAVGTIQGGYKFKGGDPSQESNWEKE